MNFYFCEACGKRLTEHQIESGAAKNKKLKGVYCKACSAGVMTMETVPLTDEKAQEILKANPEQKPSSPLKATRRSTGRLKTENPTSASKPAIPSSPLPLYLLCAGGAALFLALGVLLFQNPSPRVTKKSKSPAHSRPAKDPLKPQNSEDLALHAADVPAQNFNLKIPQNSNIPIPTAAPAPAPAESNEAAPPTKTLTQPPSSSTQASPSPSAKAEPKTTEKRSAKDNPSAEPGPKTDSPSLEKETPPEKKPERQPLYLKFITDVQKKGLKSAPDIVNTFASDPTLQAHLTKILEIWEKKDQEFKKKIELNIGKTFKWAGSSRSVGGRLAELKDGTLRFERDIIINGKRQGKTSTTVPILDLPPEIRQRIDGNTPANDEEWFAQILRDLIHKEFAAARTALPHCMQHPQYAVLEGVTDTLEEFDREDQAPKQWAAFEKKASKKVTQGQAKILLEEWKAYQATFGKTAFAQESYQHVLQEKRKELLERIAMGLDSRIGKLLHGRIVSFDPRTYHIVLEYDCKDPYQTQDFYYSQVKTLITDQSPPAKPDKDGLAIKCSSHWENSGCLKIPMVGPGDAKLTFRHKGFKKAFGLSPRFSFYMAHAPTAYKSNAIGKGPRISFRYVNKDRMYSFNEHPWQAPADSNGKVLKEGKLPRPFPYKSTIEMEREGKKHTLKADGQLMAEYTAKATGTRPGLSLGGNGDTHYTVTFIRLEFQLDPRWLKKALAKEENARRSKRK